MSALIDAAERWAKRWASEPVAPPTEEQARLLRSTFGAIKPRPERRAA